MTRETMTGVELRKAITKEINEKLGEGKKFITEKQVQAVMETMRNVIVETILDGKDILIRDFIKFVGVEKEAYDKKLFNKETITIQPHTAISCKLADTVKKEVKEKSTK